MAESPTNGSLLPVISKYGISGAIALYLVYQMASFLPKVIEKADLASAQHAIILKNQDLFINTMGDIKESIERQTKVSIQTCINGSRTDKAYQNCITP